MKLFLRLLWLMLTSSRQARLNIMDTSVTPLRVFPNDLDIFMHVNNGVYLTYADLGRTDLMLRSGTFHRLRKHGWYPVVAEETIKFMKSLTLGQSFTIHTRIAGWDDRAIYIDQEFRRGDVLLARAAIDARFLSVKGGKISVAELLEFLNIEPTSPPLPEHIQRWVSAKNHSREASTNHSSSCSGSSL